jgi:hypothetical protein
MRPQGSQQWSRNGTHAINGESVYLEKRATKLRQCNLGNKSAYSIFTLTRPKLFIFGEGKKLDEGT